MTININISEYLPFKMMNRGIYSLPQLVCLIDEEEGKYCNEIYQALLLYATETITVLWGFNAELASTPLIADLSCGIWRLPVRDAVEDGGDHEKVQQDHHDEVYSCDRVECKHFFDVLWCVYDNRVLLSGIIVRLSCSSSMTQKILVLMYKIEFELCSTVFNNNLHSST